MNRRQVLQGLAGILAAGMAPAYAGSRVLMPIKEPILTPSWVILPNPYELGKTIQIPEARPLAVVLAAMRKIPTDMETATSREMLREWDQTLGCMPRTLQMLQKNT